jgi:hypothetical protein
VKDWASETKRLIAQGRDCWNKAAALIIAAQEADPKLTQRKIAAAIGRSVGWVNALLKWHRAGAECEALFSDTERATPFAGQGPKRRGFPVGLKVTDLWVCGCCKRVNLLPPGLGVVWPLLPHRRRFACSEM